MTDLDHLNNTLEVEQVDQIVLEFVDLYVKDVDRITSDLIDEMKFSMDRRQIKDKIDKYDSELFEEIINKVIS